ncbi:hypothetical protein [Streptomyces sp. NBC_01304]|uniref:hypothetical protein n=1 Tax=Streptomyces sp. NBC_01304 TaxID=2903818 RepID=UPI002E116EC0|nr:hypothetical protein OG430_21360 [Streptomyces sp. NBC_01304]
MTTAVSALFAVGALAGAGGCTDSGGAGQAAEPSSGTSATPKPKPKPSESGLPPRMKKLIEAAQATLSDEDDDSNGDFVAAGAGPADVPHRDTMTDQTVRGDRLLIEVTCAGKGTVTAKVTSGKSKASERLDCAEGPRQHFLEVTVDSPELSVSFTPAEGTDAATAYRVGKRN